MRSYRNQIGLGLAAAIVLGGTVAQAAKPTPEPLTVFAAASLTRAFNQVGAEFQRTHPGQPVRFNFGASSALRSQLQLGAPADLFASADQEQLRPLQKVGLVRKPVVFARNRLTVVVPLANAAKIRSPRDLARPGLRLITTAPAVPIGRYTQAALASLARIPGYPSDYLARVNRNFASREPNVRSVVAKVELGEADAAVVYETDARASRRVKAIPIPEKANVMATYPVALLAASSNANGAAEFVRFLQSPAGRRILKTHGFR